MRVLPSSSVHGSLIWHGSYAAPTSPRSKIFNIRMYQLTGRPGIPWDHVGLCKSFRVSEHLCQSLITPVALELQSEPVVWAGSKSGSRQAVDGRYSHFLGLQEVWLCLEKAFYKAFELNWTMGCSIYQLKPQILYPNKHNVLFSLIWL